MSIRSPLFTLLATILALLLCASSVPSASAQTWNVGGSGTWQDGSTHFTPSYTNGGSATFSNTAGGTITLSGTISPSSTTVNASSGTYTFTGTGITSGSLSKSGGGTLILANPNTSSGNTTISGGRLHIGDGSNATARAGTGVLAVGGNTLALNLNGDAVLGNSSVTSSGLIENIGTGRVTFANGSITGIVDGGAGGIVLSNATTTNFNLKGDIAFGTVGTNRTFGSIAAGTTARITSGGGFWWIGSETAANALNLDIASGITAALNTGQAAGSLYYNNLSGAGDFTYNGQGTGYILGTSTLAGTLTAGNRDISFGNGGATGTAGATRVVANANVGFNSTTDNTYSGIMSGGGALVKNGSNVLSLTGANTYTGATTISGGTLQIGDGSTTGSLSTSSTIGGSAGATLAFARSDAVTQGTDFRSAIGGSINLAQTGSGTLVLNGTNAYTGTTSVNAGTLQIGDGGTTGSLSTSSAITGLAGATLAFNRSDTITQGTNFRSVIGGAMDVAQVGSGTLVLNGVNTYSGTTRIVAGSLSINNALALQHSTLDLDASDAGTVSAIGQNSTFGGLAGTRDLDMKTRTLSIGNNNQSTTYSGTLSNGSLTKVGSGTLTLTAANTHTGTTSINAGGLQVGDGTNATARVGTGTLAVGGNTLALNLSGDATLGNSSVTASAGGLIQNIGAGRVTLANGDFSLGPQNPGATIDGGAGGIVMSNLATTDFSIKGDVTFGSNDALRTVPSVAPGGTARIVNAGSFWWIGGETAANALSLDVASGVTLSLNTSQGAGSLYYNNLSGAGNFTYNSTATGYILGTSTMTGTLTAGNRDISFGNGGATGAAGATDIQANANVTFNTTTDQTYSGGMSGAGALIKTAANTLTLSGANTYAGGTTISAGTLVGSVSSIPGNVANGSVLEFAQAVDATFAAVVSGAGGVTKSGAGNLTFSAAQAYSGATGVSGGRLSVNNSLASSAVTVSGGTLGGSGSITGTVAVQNGGTVAPGNSIESLASGAATFAAAATFAYEVDSTNLGALGTAADLLVVSGNLNLDPGNGTLLTFTDLANTPQPFVEDTTIFALINYSGTWNGGLFTYNGNVLADGSRFSVGSQMWEIDYDRTSATGLDNFTADYLPSSSFVTVTAVPEPSTYAMALAGIACGGYLVRRRRKRA